VIEHEVGVHLQSQRVRRLDEIEHVGLGTEPRRHAAFLIQFADRVKVKYRTGKYTGTVWAAEIE
jgi:hypothetical protein